MTIGFSKSFAAPGAPDGQLNGAIDDSQLSLTMHTPIPAGIPLGKSFSLKIDSEWIRILSVGGFGNSVWTIDPAGRGFEGSLPAPHLDNADVYLETLPQDLEDFRAELIALIGGGGGILPAYLTFVPPPVTGWTWDNQGGSTVDNGASDVRFHFLGNAAALRGMHRAAPSTPYTISVALNHLLGLGSVGSAPRTGIALAFKEASSNKIIDLVLVWYDQGSYLQITRWNSATSSVLNVFNNSWLDDALREPSWLRVADDGTNIKFYIGLKRIDAIEWVLLYTEARGAFFTSHPDRIGIYGYVETGDVYGTLLSYDEA